MGYTHYFTLKKEISQEKWDSFIKDVKVLRKYLPKHSFSSGGFYSDEPLFLNGDENYREAVFDKDKVLFNGCDVPASKRIKTNLGTYLMNDVLHHETFVLSRKGCKDYCKTGRKPYDLMVQGVILLAKHHFKDEFSFGSDGDFEEWQVAFKFVSKCFPNIKNISNTLR